MQEKWILEVCANSAQSAVNAMLAGAQRIELCDNLQVGGTTPSVGCIKMAKKKVTLKINVLIRPRPGNFLYSDMEFQQIKYDILSAKELGANGIVCGILLPDGSIDKHRAKELVELSKPLPFTFHRAFDFTPDPFQALEDVIEIGAMRLLTSGQKERAVDSVELIGQLVKKADGRITVMPGGGVNINTIRSIIKTGAKEFHMSGVQNVTRKMKHQNPAFGGQSMALCNYNHQYTSKESVEAVINFLNLNI
ncbi:MAG: copper homeostasis protein CutC [Bacteroidales bacterium]